MFSRFHTIPACHGRTVRQTELLYQYRASVCWRAIKISIQKIMAYIELLIPSSPPTSINLCTFAVILNDVVSLYKGKGSVLSKVVQLHLNSFIMRRLLPCGIDYDADASMKSWCEAQWSVLHPVGRCRSVLGRGTVDCSYDAVRSCSESPSRRQSSRPHCMLTSHRALTDVIRSQIYVARILTWKLLNYVDLTKMLMRLGIR